MVSLISAVTIRDPFNLEEVEVLHRPVLGIVRRVHGRRHRAGQQETTDG